MKKLCPLSCCPGSQRLSGPLALRGLALLPRKHLRNALDGSVWGYPVWGRGGDEKEHEDGERTVLILSPLTLSTLLVCVLNLTAQRCARS